MELVRGMMQDNELIAELRMIDYRKNSQMDDRARIPGSMIYAALDREYRIPGILQNGWEHWRKPGKQGRRIQGNAGRILYRVKIQERQGMLGWQQERTNVPQGYWEAIWKDTESQEAG